jgi:hypothetical protein
MTLPALENHAARPIAGTVAVLALAAIALYLPWIDWGLPYATAADRVKTYAADEIVPMEGLAEMYHTFVDHSPERNYGYPLFHYFLVTVAQAPYLGLEKLTGRFQKPSPFYPFGFADPVEALRWLTLSGRVLSVLMGAGTVVCTFFFARNLWGYWTGVLAAVLVLLNYYVVYYSRTANLDGPAFFWISISVAIFARVLEKGLTTERAIWMGLFAGVAIATKDQSVLVLLPLGCCLLLPGIRVGAPAKAYWAGLGTSVASYVVTTGMIVDPNRHITHVLKLFLRSKDLSFMYFYHPPFPKGWAGTWELVLDSFKALMWTSSAPVLIAAALGIIFTVRVAPRRLVLLLPVLSVFLGLTLPIRMVGLRYYLPLTMMIDGFAAFALLEIGRRFSKPLAAAAIFVVCGYRLAMAVDLTHAQADETRTAAAAWFRAHAKPGERIEYFGIFEKMPPLPTEISSRRIAGRTNWVMESGHGPSILRYLASEGPEFVIGIPDFTGKYDSFDPSGDCPPEVDQALKAGTAGYKQVAYFETPSLLPDLLRPPRLDYPTVSPPVRIFARNDIAERVTAGGPRP